MIVTGFDQTDQGLDITLGKNSAGRDTGSLLENVDDVLSWSQPL